jgi:hypothetical protein
VAKSIVGTRFNDRLTGTSQADTIFGYAGDDKIQGLAGDDSLSGGDGNDIISGGSGNDIVDGGSGTNALDGGSGRDIVVLAGSRSDYQFDLSGGRITASHASGTTTIKDFELLRFEDGSSFDLVADLEALLGGAAPKPLISGISNDSGFAADGITNDSTVQIHGTGRPGNQISVFNGASKIGTTKVGTDGSWTFDYSRKALTDGEYSFTAIARSGPATSEVSNELKVIIDTTAPVLNQVALARSSDSGLLGDNKTGFAAVTILGAGEAGARVELVGTGKSAIVDGGGTFQLNGVRLAEGNNKLTFRISDAAGNTSEKVLKIEQVAGNTGGNAALTWNQIALDTIKAELASPLAASRALAIQSVAMFDVVAGIDGTPPYLVALEAGEQLSTDAAIAAAAHRVLKHLFPAQSATLDARLAEALAALPDDMRRAEGVEFGRSIADAIIAIRTGDGWNAAVVHEAGSAPGNWIPTLPAYDPPLAPHWGKVSPFALASGDEFRPAAPPALDSAEYAAAFQQVKLLGSATSTVRTAEQTEIARFWADGRGTYTPPGHWNSIANQLAVAQDFSPSDAARMLATMNIALADAGVAAWDAKYSYVLWRPVTAIHNADADGNAATVGDSGWTPLLATPPFPEYVSGHSTFSAAAAQILESIFGDVAFVTSSIGLPGVQRAFSSFDDAAQEAGMSRIYGGIHFAFGNQAGLALGEKIGNAVLTGIDASADTRPPIVILSQPNGTAFGTDLVLRGYALDNRLGMTSLEARLDGGAKVMIGIDAAGAFEIDLDHVWRDLADGSHVLALVAQDAAGNRSQPNLFSFSIAEPSSYAALAAHANPSPRTPSDTFKSMIDDLGLLAMEARQQTIFGGEFLV